MSAALQVVGVVPLVAAATATVIWSVRTAQGPRPAADAGSSPARGASRVDVAAVLALAVAAACLLVLSVLHISQSVQYELSLEYTGLVFLVPAAGWRAWRLARPGAAVLDRLAVVAPVVAGAALLLAAVEYGVLYSTTIGLIVAGLLALTSGLLRKPR